jgi:purine-cytosine permease-like protein
VSQLELPDLHVISGESHVPAGEAVVVWNVTDFLSTFTDVISAMLAPWLAIMIIGHFRAKGRYKVIDLHAYTTPGDRGAYWYKDGFEFRALAAWAIAAVVAIMFSSSTDLVGPISAHLDKIDLSFLSGFIVGGALYLAFAPRTVTGTSVMAAPLADRG